MNLIDVYIQEVTRRLPEKMREDIALELRSTIEDMLPEEYGEKEVKEVLNELGNPAVLASGYKDQPMHLIGPRYIDLYFSLVKMIMPIAAVITLITVITQYFNGYSEEEAAINIVFTIISEGIVSFIEISIHFFFWLTITFAIIERVDHTTNSHPFTLSLKKWSADDLKNITYIPKKKAISKVEVFGCLMWTAIWATAYFYANQLIGVYEGNGERLEFIMPAFNQDVLIQYWPIIILVIILEIGLSLYKLVKAQWTKKMAVYNTILQIISTIAMVIILTNSKLINEQFMAYITDLLSVTEQQINWWIIGSIIILYIAGVAINIYEGFKKAKIHS